MQYLCYRPCRLENHHSMPPRQALQTFNSRLAAATGTVRDTQAGRLLRSGGWVKGTSKSFCSKIAGLTWPSLQAGETSQHAAPAGAADL